jgi:hypothetical protein
MTVKPIRQATYEQLNVSIYPDNEAMGQAAAREAAALITQAIAERGTPCGSCPASCGRP